MKKAKIVCFVTLLFFVFVSVIMYIPIWIDDSTARSNKDRVRDLISVGQNISEAEIILRKEDFQSLSREAYSFDLQERLFAAACYCGQYTAQFF